LETKRIIAIATTVSAIALDAETDNPEETPIICTEEVIRLGLR
jgi:hypothetical protein